VKYVTYPFHCPRWFSEPFDTFDVSGSVKSSGKTVSKIEIKQNETLLTWHLRACSNLQRNTNRHNQIRDTVALGDPQFYFHIHS
jgi:hypothetical protein